MRMWLAFFFLRISEWFAGYTEEDEQDTPKTMIWGVVEGPFSREDFPEEELEEMGIPDDWNWMIVAKVSEDGKMGQVNLWYDTLDEAYEIVKYFTTNIEPLELEHGQKE